MELWEIEGGLPLRGEVCVSRAKNAVLPQMAAALLTDEPVRILNAPELIDVGRMAQMLLDLGCAVKSTPGALDIVCAAPRVQGSGAIEGLTRASVLALGPLLARCGEAHLALPGGCRIGARPIDIHLSGLEAMGAEVSIDGGMVCARGRLHPARYRLKLPSVGATENLLMAAALTPGESIIENAAREPEILDLVCMLRNMGAHVEGAGGYVLRVNGAKRLHGVTHMPIGDRIEAGTLLCAAAAAGGEVRVLGAQAAHLFAPLIALRRMGVQLASDADSIWLRGRVNTGISIVTGAFPQFPTDLQAVFMALMAGANVHSEITETMFENRMRHVSELNRMGARIELDGPTALIDGAHLRGASVEACDLRAGAALAVAAVGAMGTTRLHGAQIIRRGYENLDGKLVSMGADIAVKVTEPVSELALPRAD